jgi:23S rRNA pseudouridine1911/1915/1917 synthase
MNYRRKGEFLETPDRQRLHYFPKEELGFDPNYALALDVLYEDDFCLVVHKPVGLKVHPTQARGEEVERDTLANAVAAHFEATGQAVAVRHVHRLDADTSGPVLYAKGPLALRALDASLRDKAVGRTYVALVAGHLPRPAGTVDAAIGKDRHHAQRRRVFATGQHAVTHYRVLDTGATWSLVELVLDTGRTHQIRVHMQHLGCPLIGDRLYAGPALAPFTGQALHGIRLDFPHPYTGEIVSVDAPLPHTFTQFMHENPPHSYK